MTAAVTHAVRRTVTAAAVRRTVLPDGTRRSIAEFTTAAKQGGGATPAVTAAWAA